MTWQNIDNYCERIDGSLLSEPLNAITNLAFIIAALLLWRLYRNHNIKNPAAAILIALIFITGIGSTAFHTFANTITMWMDVLPIMIFVFFYLWTALRQLFNLPRNKSAGWLVLFLVLATQMEHVPVQYHFNGSIAYAPVLIALPLILFFLKRRGHPAFKTILQASLLFLISLTLRTLDMELCDSISIGTHLWWHVLNGFVLYLLTKVIIMGKHE